MTSNPVYHRVLLKVSGESFCPPGGFGIDGVALEQIAGEIITAHKVGVQIAVVVGGGNIIRGSKLAGGGHIPQATADYMGMMGTVINGLALKEILEKLGQPSRVLSAINLSSVAEPFIRGRAVRHLEKGRIVILAAGTGNPFFTTDTAAALRATEIQADLLIKATKVDGIYDKDPTKHSEAKRYDRLTFNDAISQNLGIMDTAAFSLCRKHGIPVVVIDMKIPGNIAKVIEGQRIGTIVES